MVDNDVPADRPYIADGRMHFPPRPELRQPAFEEARVLRIRMDLDHARPPIWRQLDIRSDLRLSDVHLVVQAAFGWDDAHLYRFALGGSPYDPGSQLFLCAWDVEEDDEEGVPAADVRVDETLHDAGDVLRYVYDYGDSWELTLTLEKVLSAAPDTDRAICRDGRRAAPPEDCGGLTDADELRDILSDPAHFDIEEVNAAIHDPLAALRELGAGQAVLDILRRLQRSHVGDEITTRLVAPTAVIPSPTDFASALAPILWFLDHVGDDGLVLTSAGYLRPADVEAASVQVPTMSGWIGKMNREVHCAPLLRFRESLQKVGLLRKHKGCLVLTRAGKASRSSAVRLRRQLVSALSGGDPMVFADVHRLVYLLCAATSMDGDLDSATVAWALGRLGWRAGGGRPISAMDLAWLDRPATHLLENITADRPGRMDRHRLSDVAVALAREAVMSV